MRYPSTKWNIEYRGTQFDGAYGMIAAIARAVENRIPMLSAEYLSGISEADFGGIVHGNVEIPMFRERLSILREVGRVLKSKMGGNFNALVKTANGDAMALLNLITHNFPSFGDCSMFRGRKVYFYKRAQLLVSDISQTSGKLKNIGELTACADYKLPFVLRRLGILAYSEQLAGRIDSKAPIEKGSAEEVEIRANTIWAVELIKRLVNTDSIHINDYLWMQGQKRLPDDRPYHLTRTTAY